jgi:hypothetical protein
MQSSSPATVYSYKDPRLATVQLRLLCSGTSTYSTGIFCSVTVYIYCRDPVLCYGAAARIVFLFYSTLQPRGPFTLLRCSYKGFSAWFSAWLQCSFMDPMLCYSAVVVIHCVVMYIYWDPLLWYNTAKDIFCSATVQ